MNQLRFLPKSTSSYVFFLPYSFNTLLLINKLFTHFYNECSLSFCCSYFLLYNYNLKYQKTPKTNKQSNKKKKKRAKINRRSITLVLNKFKHWGSRNKSKTKSGFSSVDYVMTLIYVDYFWYFTSNCLCSCTRKVQNTDQCLYVKTFFNKTTYVRVIKLWIPKLSVKQVWHCYVKLNSQA